MRLVIGAVVFLCIPLYAYAALININTASVQTLDTLPGIGEAKARDIIDYRTANGPFQTIEAIQDVSGIGDATFANIQALITVGDVVIEEEETSEVTEEKEEVKVDNDTGKDEIISLQLPETELSLALSASEIVYVNQPISFSVEPSGIAAGIIDSLQYQWNFGDLSTLSEKDPSHTFAHPGEYVVTVVASYARHEAIARQKITVLPVRFSITRNSEGDIQIHNNAKYETDISGYTIIGLERRVFPPHSMILPNGTITIAREELGSVWYDDVQFLDQEGVVVAAYDTAVTFGQRTPAPIQSTKSSDNFFFAEESTTTPVVSATPSNPSALSANVVSATEDSKISWTFIALIALIGCGIVAVYAGRIKGV